MQSLPWNSVFREEKQETYVSVCKVSKGVWVCALDEARWWGSYSSEDHEI